MIAPTPFFSHRGTHIRILEEARALEKRGHEIKIVTYHIGDDIHQYVDSQIDVRRIRRWLFWYHKTEAGANWQKIILNLFLIRKTFYLTRTWKPDVIHGHLHEGGVIGWMMKRFFFWRKLGFVVDFHGSLVGEMRSHGYLKVPVIAFVFKRIERWINAMGDAAVVSSYDHVSGIREARSDQRAYVIYDGCDVAVYDSLYDRKGSIRESYGIPTDAYVVGYTGGLVKGKGVTTLLESLMHLRDVAGLHVVIGGFPGAWVEEFVAQQGLTDMVTVISPLNYFDLPAVNIMMDVCVDPKGVSSRQASGKILGYIAARKRVICLDRATNRKYLGETASYINTSDPILLADAIKKYQGVSLTKTEEDVIREKALHFSWERVGERLEGVYMTVT